MSKYIKDLLIMLLVTVISRAGRVTRVFKEQFGLSVTSYLTQLRITQAKRLLRFTDKSVENVAQECGLNDANYFSRLFKKVEGTTPGEYRRQW